ncbi:MAG: hypothetical protein K1Y01_02745 [Vicinamibacteria bacterium]|nr:hypothetical protein [Vicinamibacteria bacterium]
MMARSRLAIGLAGLAAAVFLAWPEFSIDRNGDWRKALAGFQLQKETGDFIGAANALIHFHGLDGRGGWIRFTLTPRISGDAVAVDIRSSSDVKRVALGATPVEVEMPFGRARDLELRIAATAATNPRPIVLSGLRLYREFTTGMLGLSLLPLLLGVAVALLTRREEDGRPGAVGVFTIVAAAFLILVASEPSRALSLAPDTMRWAPILLALGFAVIGVRGRGWTSATLALAGGTVSLHVLTVHSGFVYDDRLWARPWTLAELASTFAGSEDPRGISGEQYRPIPSLTHALDHAIYGPSAFAFHGTNMALHALSALMLFALLIRLGLPRAPAFLGGLTLVAHPMAASSVGWISERTDTLADIFMLATLMAFLGPKGTRPLRVLGVALLALWSKETAVMLPALAILLGLVALDREQWRARHATIRALIGFVVLYVAVWVSLFPEKTVGRLQATAATLQSEQSGWVALFGSLFSQLFHPIGFEIWRATRDSLPAAWWFGLAVGVGGAALGASFIDAARALPWRLVAAGLTFSALVVLPFRGHDAVDVYRLGHTPTVGFALAVAGFASIVVRQALWRSMALAVLLILRFGPVAAETSSAWGYPGFQFRMALRFNLENPMFLGGLTPEMKRDLERESRFEAHRDDPLRTPFEP